MSWAALVHRNAVMSSRPFVVPSAPVQMSVRTRGVLRVGLVELPIGLHPEHARRQRQRRAQVVGAERAHQHVGEVHARVGLEEDRATHLRQRHHPRALRARLQGRVDGDPVQPDPGRAELVVGRAARPRSGGRWPAGTAAAPAAPPRARPRTGRCRCGSSRSPRPGRRRRPPSRRCCGRGRCAAARRPAPRRTSRSSRTCTGSTSGTRSLVSAERYSIASAGVGTSSGTVTCSAIARTCGHSPGSIRAKKPGGASAGDGSPSSRCST